MEDKNLPKAGKLMSNEKGDIMGILSWIIIGGLAGWAASMIMNTDAQMGALANIVVGIIGGLLGGFITSNLIGVGIDGFSIQSFLVALLGAVVLIAILKAIKR